MTPQILTELARLEAERNIKILYAVESGSRAWGFASTDSDWDVRFIYVHPMDWYLSIDDKKDNIEQMLPNDVDLAGWELRKALRLFRKSNPPLLEWLSGPIVYAENYNTAAAIRRLAGEIFNPKACMYHYLHMAERNFKEYLLRDSVRLKKYFYVLRPVLACMWIERERTMPPVEFHKMLETEIPSGEIKDEISALTIRKMSGEELSEGPRIDVLHNFLEEKILYYKNYLSTFDLKKQPDTQLLDAIFRDAIRQVWQ